MVLLCADGGGITRNRTLPSVLTTGQVLSFLSGSSLLFSPLPSLLLPAYLPPSPPTLCIFRGARGSAGNDRGRCTARMMIS